MILLLLFILPIITSVSICLYKHIKDLWIWLMPPILYIGICGSIYLCMLYDNIHDTEYCSYYYTKIRYEEEWNERIRHTRQVKVGKTYQTQIYYTTHTHPEYYCAYLNNGDKVSIKKSDFNKIKSQWNTSEIFIDMHRHYYTKDGDAYEYEWNNKKQDIYTYTKSHQYINPIIGSDSQFKFNDITYEESIKLGLYQYPLVKNNKQNPIIGYNKFVTKSDIENLRYINSYYGYKKEITCFLLIYPNTTVSIVEDQKSYWQSGNKNEFIICVGIDSLTNNVQWAECFSWQDDITLDVNCKSYILNMNNLNISKLTIWLENNLHLWKRKEFEDFSYLNVDLTTTQNNILLVIIFIFSIFEVFFIGYLIKD